MLSFVKLQFLIILSTLILATCKPYGAKGGSKATYAPDAEDEFELGSGWGGFQEKHPSENGNKEIKFMNMQIDLENNDHLGSHGPGVGNVPHGTKPNVGKNNYHASSGTSSYSKGVQYADKDPTLGLKDPSFFKREETYGGKDFIPKDKDITVTDLNKDFYGGTKDSTDGNNYEGQKDLNKDFYGGNKDTTGGNNYEGQKDLNKYFIEGNKDSSYGISSVGQDVQNTNGDKIDSEYGDNGNSPGRKDIPYLFNDYDKERGKGEHPVKKDEFPKGGGSDDSSDEFPSDDKDSGLFENFGSILKGLKEKVKFIGDKIERKAKSAFGRLKESHSEAKEKSHNFWEKVVDKFWEFWGKVDRVVGRGGQYVFQGITNAYDDAKGSQLIAKLTQRLVEGDKVLDHFFKKVGEKVSKWLQQHGHDNVDEGLFAPEKEVEEQFSNPQFPNLFQDIEIHQELDKLVQSGIIQKEDMDQLSQIQIITKDKKVKVQENSSAPYSAVNEDKKLKYGENKARELDDKEGSLKEAPKENNVVAPSKGSTEPKLKSYISEKLKSWVNSIVKIVSPR